MYKNLKKTSLLVILLISFSSAQDVSIAVIDTVSDGYADNILVPVTISNPNGNVGGVQFDVSINTVGEYSRLPPKSCELYVAFP